MPPKQKKMDSEQSSPDGQANYDEQRAKELTEHSGDQEESVAGTNDLFLLSMAEASSLCCWSRSSRSPLRKSQNVEEAQLDLLINIRGSASSMALANAEFEAMHRSTTEPFFGKFILKGGKIGAIEKAIEECRENQDFDLYSVDVSEKAEWESTYKSFKSLITIHAIHLAASRGSIPVMQWLLGEPVCGPSVKDQRAKITREGAEEEDHYTPIMCALWMSETKAVKWLLNQGVDLSIKNADGSTAWHVFARTGLFRERGNARNQCLEEIARDMFQNSEEHCLSERTGPLEHRQDDDAKYERQKTALEIASWHASQFPQNMLYLLTNAYQCPKKSSPLAELFSVAKLLPHATLELWDKLPAQELELPLRDELSCLVPKAPGGENNEEWDEKNMNTISAFFLHVLMWCPLVGAQLMKLLMREPDVSDPQKYPLPSYAILRDDCMICTYQSVTNDKGHPVWWNKDKEWHRVFGRHQEAPGPFSRDYAVKVKVLWLPGILNRRVLYVLAILDHDQHLFSQIPIVGIVTCVWDHVVKLNWFLLAWDVLFLCILLTVSLWRPSDQTHRHILQSAIIAEVVLLGMNLAGGIRFFSFLRRGFEEKGLQVTYKVLMRIISTTDVAAVVVLLFLSAMCDITTPSLTAYDRVILAFIVVFWCCRIVKTLQVFSVIGPLVVAVARSFFPMLGMFTFMALVFVMFLLVFVTFRDKGRSLGFVFLYLYETLLLADRDTAEIISGLDLAHEQDADFDFEMYTGGGQKWLLKASSFVAMVGMTVFSLVLLNLTIGMYANYYQEIKPVANLIFTQKRARNGMRCMIHPSWVVAQRIKALTTSKNQPEQDTAVAYAIGILKKRLGLTILGLIVCFFYCSQAALYQPNTIITSLWLAAAVFCVQVALSVEKADLYKRKDFLWMCYRADYDEEFYNMGHRDVYELGNLKRGLAESRKKNEDHVQKLTCQLDKTKQLLQDLTGQFDKSNGNFKALLSELELVTTTVSASLTEAEDPGVEGKKYVKGEQVEVFSVGAQQWFFATIDEAFHSDCLFNGYSIMAGTLLVTYARGSKYVLPQEVGTYVRKVRKPPRRAAKKM